MRAALVWLGLVIGTVSVSLATGDWEGDALRVASYAVALVTYELTRAADKIIDEIFKARGES